MTSSTVPVPQANPGAGYRALKQEIDAAVARTLESGWYILGQEGRAFEAEFAAWASGSAQQAGSAPGHTAPSYTAIGCGNGTDAIALALRGLGIGAGSTVVTVSHTAVATVAAVEMVGATPLLIDIEPDFYTMDPAELEAVLASPPRGLPPIRAVLVVHLYGQAADLQRIKAVCDRFGVALVEDCAQAHGARHHGQMVGTVGDVATFSFYPTKNLGALGDGGAVLAREPVLAARIAALRQYGWQRHYVSDDVGINSRLDEIQAAILRVKLTHLDAQNARRNAIAAAYDAALEGREHSKPVRRPGADHVFHLYVLRTRQRDALQATLRASEIGSGIHYPMPVHRQPAYAGRIALGPAACRQTEAASGEILSLPMFPELTDRQVEQVCTVLRRA